MRLNRAALTILCCLISMIAFAQKETELLLKTGRISLSNNIRSSFIDSFHRTAPKLSGKTTVLVKFAEIPTADQRQQLASAGIELHNYLSAGVYTATISGRPDAALLGRLNMKSLVQLTPLQKTDPLLAGNRIPAHIIKVPGTIDVNITYPASYSPDEVQQFLKSKLIDIVSNKWVQYGQLTVRLIPGRLQELAGFAFVEYVEPVGPEVVLFNHKSRQGTRANVLNSAVADGGYGLNGEGIVLGIGDNTAIYNQADFSGRNIERNTNSASHGIHVAGTAAGGGIVNELYRGFAPKATIVNALQADILSPVYVRDYNMVVTNNSYGGGFLCEANGRYDGACISADKLTIEYPYLLNVFGAGNYGTNQCLSYPYGFGTISAMWQGSKNALIVGGTNDSMEVQPFSSRGPVKDGRIKPEIIAMGLQVTSTWPNNNYSFNSGTSMSSPAVAGGAALLYQRYRQLHAGADPKNGLIKAVLCNGAIDKGHPGPDYSNGFGVMNLLRSIDMLNKQHYFNASATHNNTSTHTITVPENTAQLKVMLYWNDPAGSLLAPRALVHDLDLEVVTPGNTTLLPFVLDTTSANVANPATRGVDRLNNIEQIIVQQPASGSYTLRVKGTSVAQQPSQEYFLVYDIVPVSLAMSYPIGNEAMVPGELVKLSWEAYGNTDKTFTLQYSTDNGANWTDIASNIAAARRIYTWQVPAIATANALIRIVQDGTGLTSTSKAFTIIGLPAVTLAPVQCPTYFAINWTPVAGAERYEVMMLKGDELKVVDTTSSFSYTFTGLSRETLYWAGVRAVINGKAGRRSVSISRRPDNGTCSGSISDNDLMVEALVSPTTGRKHTSIELKADESVTIRIRNLDDAPTTSFTLSYAMNNVWHTETVSAVVPANGTYEHTFTTTSDLSAVATYRIHAVVKNDAADPSSANDTLIVDIRNLDNQPIDLTNTFLDNLEMAAPATYIKDTIGLAGIDRYDFESVTKSGQVVTFLNSDMHYSGKRSFIIGETWQHSVLGLNYVTGTFNLSAYDVHSNNLRADFRQMNSHFGFPNDAFWVRGSDTSQWIRITAVTRTDTNYRLSASLPIADSLAAHGQQFSSSFQMRWGQSSVFTSLIKNRMYAIDDIRLYHVSNDLQLLKVDTPSVMSCAVTGNVPLKVTVYNSHFTTLTNIPVKYMLNDGQWIEEIIPSIPAKSSIKYTFNSQIDLSRHASYKLKVVVAYPTDNFRVNDSANIEIQNSILITSFPYLQNFESGTDGWYTAGQNSSWAYGTPVSEKIKGAASGAKAWKTNLTGSYNNNEVSYLYTPCFDLSKMARPMISFSISFDFAECNSAAPPCDGAWLEYTTNGVNWIRYGGAGIGTNWYNAAGMWAGFSYPRWHVASYIPGTTSVITRFRFVFSSNGSVNKDGIAIDDFHVFDYNELIYDSVTMPSPVTQNVSGNGWTHFRYSGSKILASINPNGQNLGAVDAQVYLHTPGVRSTSTQYYHNRNLTLKAANAFNDSVTIRWYFLDKEADSLIFANSCIGCAKPSSAYELGVSTYSDANKNFENGTIEDNKNGNWAYINSFNVAKVPYDRGYYAEFKVKSFSEFWLNNGGIDFNAHLAIQLLEFTAQRSGDRSALLQWRMGDEKDITRYEIEIARDHAAMQANQFMRIGQVQAGGALSPASYNFTDNDPDKFDTVYYRMKMVYTDGRSAYSPVRYVVFDGSVPWSLYPNPSAGRFVLDFPGSANETMQVSVFDAKGSLIRSFNKPANGFMQKLVIDLSEGVYPPGVYLLRVTMGGSNRTFKLYKR